MPTALLGLSVTIPFPFKVSFGVSTDSGQKIPVRKMIMRMEEIRFVFVLMIPFFLLSWGSYALTSLARARSL
jgi:hypothetical protein